MKSVVKKSILFNVISIVGYLVLFYSIYAIFIKLPNAYKYDMVHQTDPIYSYGAILYTLLTLLWILGLTLVLFIAALAQLLINKKNNSEKWFFNVPDKFTKVHTFLFWIGIVLAPLPLYLFSALLIYSLLH